MTALEAGIVTADAGRLVAFYCDGLGFSVEQMLDFPQGTVHRIRRDEARCKIYQPVGGALPTRLADPWFQFAGHCYAALHVDDAEAEVSSAVACGATVLVALTNHRPGAWFALIADPEGNVWEILQDQSPVVSSGPAEHSGTVLGD